MAGLIVVAGPTASGKSDLALRLAEALGGVIVNADSMQLYRDLRILSARPSPEEEVLAPHRLYGVLDAAEVSSAGRWLEMAGAELAAITAEGRPAIVTGGTGLYLEALLEGIAAVPDIPDEIRAATRARFAALGPERFHAEVARLDPVMAARLRPTDRQRLMRAHEVVVATGRSLAGWQAAARARIPLPEPFAGFALMPPRDVLYARIELRLAGMLEAGALDEVRALAARDLPPDLPLMKAVGLPALLAHMRGGLDRERALELAVRDTRRFAKRQLTWLRHRLPGLERIAGFGDDPAVQGRIAAAGRRVLTGPSGAA